MVAAPGLDPPVGPWILRGRFPSQHRPEASGGEPAGLLASGPLPRGPLEPGRLLPCPPLPAHTCLSPSTLGTPVGPLHPQGAALAFAGVDGKKNMSEDRACG